jgi:hypothetical protein
MDNVYGGNGLFAQEYGFNSDNAVEVNRLYYSFPVGDEFTVVAGPRVRMDDMLPVWPSAYPSDMTYDFFTYAGAPGAYNLALGAGAGVYWQTEGGFSVSTSYLSVNGNKSCPNNDFCGDSAGGIGTDAAAFSATTQIAYAPESWGIAAAYTKASGVNGVELFTPATATLAAALSSLRNSQLAIGLSAWWTPEESGWIPSISTGWGLTNVQTAIV